MESDEIVGSEWIYLGYMVILPRVPPQKYVSGIEDCGIGLLRGYIYVHL